MHDLSAGTDWNHPSTASCCIPQSATPSSGQQSHQDPAYLLLGRATQPHPRGVWCEHRWELEGKMKRICFAPHSASGVLAKLFPRMAEFGFSMVKPQQLLDEC